MEVNGTLINYYFHCQRQCYLHGNRLNLEDESENVKIGKALHEEKYKDDKNSEIAIDNIRLDKLTAKYLTETKKSDADLVAAKWQLLYYLKILKSKGIIRKGRIEVIEKNKQNKSFIEVELTEIEEKELDKIVIKIKELLENEIQVCTESLSGKVVLVGPTGVGKTTTIAKLAGRLALIEKKKVGLITIDTYRIGAVEQLKTYAEIMNIPFKVVITLKEMENAVSELEDCDAILIDTTGRSSKNTMQISELRAFTQKVNADHIALVISGTTKNRDIQTIINGYSEIGYEKMIITKLDETSSYGCIYNIIKKAQKPIAYITTGQNVPDDIRIPLKSEISKLILGEETVC